MDDLYNRVARRRRAGQRGFTLIELLVVIAVLAILALIVVFNVVGVANKGNKSACDTDVKTLQTALDAYYNDNNGWNGNFGFGDFHTPAAITAEFAALSPQYIHSVPTSCADSASGAVYGVALTDSVVNGVTSKTVAADHP